jgi:hypothetical protein
VVVAKRLKRRLGTRNHVIDLVRIMCAFSGGCIGTTWADMCGRCGTVGVDRGGSGGCGAASEGLRWVAEELVAVGVEGDPVMSNDGAMEEGADGTDSDPEEDWLVGGMLGGSDGSQRGLALDFLWRMDLCELWRWR